MALPSKRLPPPKRADDAPTESRRWRCFADSCPLPGSISLGSDWACAFHAQAGPLDLARITSVLFQHKPITDELLAALGSWGTSPTDKRAHDAQIETAKRRLAAAGYEIEWEKTPARAPARPNGFVYALQCYLGGMVANVAPLRRQAAGPVHSARLPGVSVSDALR